MEEKTHNSFTNIGIVNQSRSEFLYGLSVPNSVTPNNSAGVGVAEDK